MEAVGDQAAPARLSAVARHGLTFMPVASADWWGYRCCDLRLPKNLEPKGWMSASRCRSTVPFQPAPAAKSRVRSCSCLRRGCAPYEQQEFCNDKRGHHLAADLVFRIAIVGLFLFSAVLASMLWLNVRASTRELPRMVFCPAVWNGRSMVAFCSSMREDTRWTI